MGSSTRSVVCGTIACSIDSYFDRCCVHSNPFVPNSNHEDHETHGKEEASKQDDLTPITNSVNEESKDKPQFSNEDGSHLSSLGKYRLEGRGYSNWGINVKYLMHGMENTNSNALKRVIVFHSWELMSDEETFPEGSPEGWGCPTISNNAMKRVDPILQQSKTPVLMWIYN